MEDIERTADYLSDLVEALDNVLSVIPPSTLLYDLCLALRKHAKSRCDKLTCLKEFLDENDKKQD